MSVNGTSGPERQLYVSSGRIDVTETLSMNVDRHGTIDQEVVDAISSLGNSKRLQMLLALDEVEREHHERRHTKTFTELYEAVDIESSSQFSYHLNRLVGQFVSETPNGYRLTYSGTKIVRVIRSGVYETTSAFADREVSGACLFCDETTLLATLDSDQFRIRCTSCDAVLVTDFCPESQTRGRTPTGIIESYCSRIWSVYVQLRGGICPECFGPVETVVSQYEHSGNAQYIHNSSCRECQFLVSMPVEVPVAFHPAVLSLFWDHGVSILDVPLWEFYEYITSDVIGMEVVSEDPFDACFTVTLDDDTLSLRMDDSVTVTLDPCDRD